MPTLDTVKKKIVSSVRNIRNTAREKGSWNRHIMRGSPMRVRKKEFFKKVT